MSAHRENLGIRKAMPLFGMVAACALLLASQVSAGTYQPEISLAAHSGFSDFDAMLPQIQQLSQEMHSLDILTAAASLPDSQVILPAVPSAIFMGLFGFLCLTLVRDRKFWLFVAISTCTLGVTGLQYCTRLIASAAPVGQACDACEPGSTSDVAHPRRSRADLDGTAYIGLLHHLGGIPRSALALINIGSSSPRVVDLTIPRIPAHSRFFPHITAEFVMSQGLDITFRSAFADVVPAFRPGLACNLRPNAPPGRQL